MIFCGTNAVVASLFSLLNMLCPTLTSRSHSKAPSQSLPSSSSPPTTAIWPVVDQLVLPAAR
ncbi:hypothetical protein PR003_g29170 [Phytophthora rubi]|uniref:RxLR effector protein n=1 Tax=Phytophthora rubi TaxID=129364 RepID=A0A6A4BMZ4_9STRA|nr:hypothetical protein PR003_g29170 [Phytophthora rubi]